MEDQQVPEWDTECEVPKWYEHVEAPTGKVPVNFMDEEDEDDEEEEEPPSPPPPALSQSDSVAVRPETPPSDADVGPDTLPHELDVVYICTTSGESLLNKVKRYDCDMCKKTFSHRSGLSRHRNTHFGLRHNCTFCRTRFTRSDSLSDHVRRVHYI